MQMIISMEYKDIEGVLVWISQKDSSVAPFSLFISFSLFSIFLFFWWPQWLFLFNSHLSSLGSFIVSTLGSFPHLRATLYLQEGIGNLSHFTRYSKHKEDVTIMMYAMYASASVAEYAMILAHHVAMIRARPN